MVFCSVLGFNKPSIEGDQLPVTTGSITVSIQTNTSPIITSKTITNFVMVSIVFLAGKKEI